MIRKRLVGVITVKDSLAVQSFGYKNYLPLGNPEILVENLDRWGVDEILVLCIDRTVKHQGPDFYLLERLSAKGISTPLIYGGGISKLEQAVKCIQLGAERICIDAALHGDKKQIYEISSMIGAQSLIASLPLHMNNRDINYFNYLSMKSISDPEPIFELFTNGIISEALIIDWHNEGQAGSFNMNLLKCFPYKEVSFIVFGGLSETSQLSTVFKHPQVAAVGIGNFFNYKEHAVLANLILSYVKLSLWNQKFD